MSGKIVSKNICQGPRMNKDCFKNTGFVSKKELGSDGNVYFVETYIDGQLVSKIGNEKVKTKAQIKMDMENIKYDLRQEGIDFDYRIVKVHKANKVYDNGETKVYLK